MDCMDLQHEISRALLHGKLFIAPISDTPGNILDVGTGTGTWTIEVADYYPSAVVTGTDIFPIQPKSVPPNCYFLLEDANETWEFQIEFDLIHCRHLRGNVKEGWLFAEAYRNLRPGGWLEVAEMVIPLICKETIWEDTALKACAEEMMDASRRFGTPFDNP
jgi:ubiquinone/menaquinone biosynthesis C-methylase UbiE